MPHILLFHFYDDQTKDIYTYIFIYMYICGLQMCYAALLSLVTLYISSPELPITHN